MNDVVITEATTSRQSMGEAIQTILDSGVEKSVAVTDISTLMLTIIDDIVTANANQISGEVESRLTELIAVWISRQPWWRTMSPRGLAKATRDRMWKTHVTLQLAVPTSDV